MKVKKVFKNSLTALGVSIVLAFFFSGCEKGKDGKVEEVYPAENHSYMKDPAFKAQLDKQEREQRDILGERNRLFTEFEKLEKRAGSRKAAEKLDEWKALERQAKACADNFESNRWHTMVLLRERLKKAREDSARIKRGEAREKK